MKMPFFLGCQRQFIPSLLVQRRNQERTRSEFFFRTRFAHPMSSNSFGLNPRQTVDDFLKEFAHLRLDEKFQSEFYIRY